MNPSSSAATAAQAAPAAKAMPSMGEMGVVRRLLPYLWEFRGRVLLALALLVSAKLANITVPVVMKKIVDGLSQPAAVAAIPLALLVAYGVLRLSSTLFNELRDVVFVKVAQRAMRRVALEVFHHLHALSLRFHLERQTGGLTRDIERGTRGISTLLSFMVFSVLPTLLEMSLVTGFLIWQFDVWFGVITVAAIMVYVLLTFVISEWRTHHRRQMNEMDSKANTRAVDSLLNYETVKYFGNESYEARRYDENLQRYERAVVKSETSLGLLNSVQAGVIAVAVSLLMWRSAEGIVAGKLTLGDLVMVNALLIQLYIPLNFLGVMYREIKQAMVDMEKMFRLLGENREIADRPGAKPLAVTAGAIRFENVDFGYEAARQILKDVSFEVPAGSKVAVVGSSGSGKSTLARLLFRFYDVDRGRITIDGQDIREVQQASVRAAIGVVPQDTVLFNDTIYYNIAYGRPEATREEIEHAARVAHIAEFIERLPIGWDTTVGERGLKLSGGEKQRVSIARTLLKQPPILIFDEATSALDSRTEKSIQAELSEIARDHTTLVIAHRLSTIVDADEILVLDQGRIVERGSFRSLLAANGRFAEMWRLQQEQQQKAEENVIPAKAGIQAERSRFLAGFPPSRE
jgi:ATP-binding cassette, subfamily B, heavy metal transporter